MPLLEPRLVHRLISNIEKNKKFFLSILIIFIVVIIFIIVRPFIDRARDNSEVMKVEKVFIQLKDIVSNKHSSDYGPLSAKKANQIAASDTSFSKLRHPHNNRPYEIKDFNEEDIINGPEGRKFINYEMMDGVSFYIGNGKCDDPAGADIASTFLAYSVKLRRVNENSGRCINL